MKTLAILALILLAAGCRSNKQLKEYSEEEALAFTQIVTTVKIDNCEYITGKAPNEDYGWVFTHKGNCKNCRKFYTELSTKK